MITIQAFIKRHSVLLYFVLTLLISWGGLLIIMGPGGMLGVAAVSAERMPFLYLAMLLGPTIAGLFMTGLVYRRAGFSELLSRLRRWRIGAGWYLIAVLTAPGLMAGTLLLLSQFSPAFVPGIVTSSDKVTLLVSGLVAGILVGIFEELGWTGFAIPRLRLHYGVLATSLIVGFVWGLWHMPLFTESARASQSVSPLISLAVLLFSHLPAFRVLLVWVYDRTGSLLVAMLMHVSQTATTLIFAIPATDIQAVLCNLVYTAALWTFVAVVGIVNRGHLEGKSVEFGRIAA
ncbi:MAG TPA: CPBP family intramembrane glutamic endopeptidase [Anaerolineales bacterium]|nr:CPBP family intramembrane glutamic endopeptidase [Anaerolineales bacterium]